MENMEARIREIIVRILGVSETDISGDTAIGDLPEWDSLRHIQIISAVEKEFGFRFTPDVIMDLEDVSDIAAAAKDRAGK